VIFNLSLPSVGKKALGKELFAECCICDTRQRALCQVPKKSLGKEIFYRVSKIKHSAKNLALGKEPNSGSDLVILIIGVGGD
jgi:hypothetical protein